MSRLRERANRHDRFYRQAKTERYAARSVYKLEEIDRRFRLLRPGLKVLDLGCRPGSWLQFTAMRVGPTGFVVGLDRLPLDIRLPDNAAVLTGDVLELDPEILRAALPMGRASCFQLVLTDMAPDTTGVSCTDQVRSVELFLRALTLCRRVGCPGGSFLGKIFMGEGFEEALTQFRGSFKNTRTVRPEATRKESREVYLLGQGLRPSGA